MASKIAISTDSGMVSEHFGRCPQFTIVEINDGKLISQKAIPNPGHHPGFLPEFLHEQGVEAIVCGGMGFRAQELFKEKGIETIMGASGSIDEVIEKLLQGTLKGGISSCSPGLGKGYGLDKTECDHEGEEKK